MILKVFETPETGFGGPSFPVNIFAFCDIAKQKTVLI
jgi:hypothetical protein